MHVLKCDLHLWSPFQKHLEAFSEGFPLWINGNSYLHSYGLGRTLWAILDTAYDGSVGSGVRGGEVKEQVGQVHVHVIVSLHHLRCR